jgi:predicted ATPase
VAAVEAAGACQLRLTGEAWPEGAALRVRMGLHTGEAAFADGAWLAELAPVRDPAGVDDAAAAVFSLTARAGQGTRDALAELLRGKELLLVLDNCEHLLEAAAGLAETLARACERLVILATSREALGVDGERVVPVPPLGVPGAGAGLDAITQAEAVRLFAERAAAVKPGFGVAAANAAAVAAVVRRLDGIALAVELAAARVPAMTPAELAGRLDRSLAVLAGGRRGAAERHQTLRAVIDWSFQLLSESEKALLARLAVFAGGCTLEAAEAVCGGEGIGPDMVFGLLASLVARSLVAAEDHGTQTRYRLLETIRQYGEERLGQSGETERWRARHAGHYADLLRRVRDHPHDPQEEVFWAVRLGAEQDNLLAAWSWAIGAGNVDTAFKILAGFAPVEVWSSYPLVLAWEACSVFRRGRSRSPLPPPATSACSGGCIAGRQMSGGIWLVFEPIGTADGRSEAPGTLPCGRQGDGQLLSFTPSLRRGGWQGAGRAPAHSGRSSRGCRDIWP